jgi:hypothetical protein
LARSLTRLVLGASWDRIHAMNTSWTASLLLLGAALVASACETTRVGETYTFEEAVRTYAAAEGRKALALAADDKGKRAWGAQYGKSLSSQERATREALEECDANAQRLGVQAECHLFAVGERQSRSTLEKCSARRINPKRCALQEQYAPLLVP